jgi:DNA polymerase-4
MAESPRKIIHIDCDCFYASVEIRDDPSLAALPVGVGGAADRRGVLTTCNYLAREYGVRSAMPTAQARRLCPGLVVLPVNFDKYRAASRDIRRILLDYTDRVEPLSLDEAYLDVSEARSCQGSATLIAREIRERVRREVGITVSAGVAPNKFVAKVASDWNKPDGLCVVRPEEVDGFVRELPVRRIFGVGRVTAEKLHRLGVETCGDLREFSVFELTRQFGRFGARLHELCRGRDSRPVAADHARKSLSVENTFDQDLPDVDSLRVPLQSLLITLKSRLRHVGDGYRIVAQTVKLKFSDFQLTTVERASPQADAAVFLALLEEAYARRELPVRLLGLGVRFVDLDEDSGPDQLELDFRSP